MKRSTGLRSDPEKAAAWRRRSKPLARESRGRRAERPQRDAVRAAVLERDGHRCRLRALYGWACMGPPTVHHIRKEGQGGAYAADNLVCLCAGHNADVECEPDRYWQLGLVQRAGDDPEDTWRRLWLYGLAAFPYPGSRP